MYAIAGESLVDLVRQDDGDYRPVPGGAPYNFARALARQEVPVAYLNPLSTDLFGDTLLSELEASGARHLGRRVKAPTSLALLDATGHGEPAYEFYRLGVADRDVDADDLLARVPPGVTGFHTGGLALVPPDAGTMQDVATRMRANGVVCSVDVNMRPAAAEAADVSFDAYRDAVLAVAREAHIVKVSEEDLVHLDLTGDATAAATSFLARGSKLVLLTRGARGATLIAPGIRLDQPAFAMPVVDTIGAGDCFLAGFVAFLQREGSLHGAVTGRTGAGILQASLRHASACAALVLGAPGCRPPTWHETVHLTEGRTPR
ncbi:MAG: carbohydrate kinase [Betaproteobacteria bacterium]|nr:carbohydrate kinase [Betaproteobacteria bacterium]